MTALLLYAVIHIFVVFYVVHHFRKYNPERLSISRLGTKKSPKYKLLNHSSFILGVLVTLFGLQLGYLSPYAVVMVTTIGVFLTLSSMFAYDKYPMIHDTVAGVIVLLCVIFSLSFVWYALSVDWLPKFLILVSLGIPICAGMLVFEMFHRIRRSKFPKDTWYWEWGIYALEMIFIVTSCFSILKR
ncbi:MAG TPA: DUF998 domain-containing protein [Patescibacteria group bacterium]|nr:DUF998 domain-containing protein [Patescibacteria group bacterium]